MVLEVNRKWIASSDLRHARALFDTIGARGCAIDSVIKRIRSERVKFRDLEP